MPSKGRNLGNICPECYGYKDSRAVRCVKCRSASGDSRRGTGKYRLMSGDGYALIHVPNHPNSDLNGYVKEHRFVMECHLHRFLSPNEVVHHINSDRLDNSLDNLQLIPFGEHTGLHNHNRRT